jgi:membrane fusion protein (multidrug efflux system)
MPQDDATEERISAESRPSRHCNDGVARALPLLLLLLVLLTAACKPQATASKAPPPALEVTTTQVVPRDVAITYSYAGRIAAFRTVEVRARVGGILLQRHYLEGDRVNAGDILFQIDPAPYQAAAARAAALVRQQQAQRDKARRDVWRTSALLASHAGTQVARDDALSALDIAEAGLAAAQADLQTQMLNLNYTKVTAPLSGVTSLEIVPEGSVVDTGTDNNPLTRIAQTDPAYVSFAFDPDELVEIRVLTGTANPRLTAAINIGGQRREGVVDFIDSRIDPSTGTVPGRALFANGDAGLLPGQFVRISLGGVTLPHALTVPKAAVEQDAGGAFVYVADAGQARRVEVALQHETDSEWVVSGLHTGEQIVTGGLVNLREGSRIRIVRQ